MRVIGGEAGGRPLTPPKDRKIRPTSDKVREAIFNILSARLGNFEEMAVLDLFAGTGALGIEALSRGAGRAVFIDSSREAVGLITRNLATLGFSDRGRVVANDALVAVKREEAAGRRFHLVFLDPPYGQGVTEQLLTLLASSSLIDSGSLVVAEFSSREILPTVFGRLAECDRRVYGDTAVAFLEII